jgi:hypothetical protein
MAHGRYPIPPPAVAELLKGAPVYSTEIEGELVTPTGAAIISTLCERYGAIPEMQIETVAYGAGTREYERFPNVLRLMIGESSNAKTQGIEDVHDSGNEKLTLIETNIDDLSPQILGFVMERALQLGALDCWFTPIQMKKNRPATMVSILCENIHVDVMTDLLITETSTLGIRRSEVSRTCVNREFVQVDSEFGPIKIKIGRYKGRIVNIQPEFEDVRNTALRHKVPLKLVTESALWAARTIK